MLFSDDSSNGERTDAIGTGGRESVWGELVAPSGTSVNGARGALVCSSREAICKPAYTYI